MLPLVNGIKASNFGLVSANSRIVLRITVFYPLILQLYHVMQYVLFAFDYYQHYQQLQQLHFYK